MPADSLRNERLAAEATGIGAARMPVPQVWVERGFSPHSCWDQ